MDYRTEVAVLRAEEQDTYPVLRVCSWCSTAAQRLEMAMWSDVPEELVRRLRAAGGLG